MQRYEAVALLKELGAEQLIHPSLVLIEQRKPDSYQLCVKGDYDLPRLKIFLHQYTLDFEEDTKGFLCIFKP